MGKIENGNVLKTTDKETELVYIVNICNYWITMPPSLSILIEFTRSVYLSNQVFLMLTTSFSKICNYRRVQ